MSSQVKGKEEMESEYLKKQQSKRDEYKVYYSDRNTCACVSVCVRACVKDREDKINFKSNFK